ncbi:MAG: hypothetical protein JWR85_547 [Marmoricola sp.]|nr:hypothetical protein [Marmoricola sp.]
MRTTYDATVEVATKDRLDVDDLMTALAEYKPVLGTSVRGWHEIRLSVPAATLAQACHTAISVATAATGAKAIACEVMTTQQTDERSGQDVPSQTRASARGSSLRKVNQAL